MIILLVFYISTVFGQELDPAPDQIVYFKNKTLGPVGCITTSSGAPVTYKKANSSLNKKLIYNDYFMDIISHVVRERIPERVVHAKGTGAYGYFEVTHDISHICKADFLSKVGKRTRVIVRFSPTASERGSPDLILSPQGFSIKYFTKQGNFDFVGFNTPMYFYKDPLFFASFTHATKRNPATNLMDAKTFWDMITSRPEAIHVFMLLFAGRAFPASYRNLPGYSCHTYQVENAQGTIHFMQFHFLPDGGIKNFTFQEARSISAATPDYLTADLYRAIEKGDFPCWTLYVKIFTINDLKKHGFRLFDVTRVVPKEYPLVPVGKLCLNKNVKNFHAEIEQLAFNPGHVVPGICGAPDKLFESRSLAYREAQIYRLGVNFNKIEVNCPFQSLTYNRDGLPPVRDNEEDIPNYYPNSINGPVPYLDNESSELIDIVESDEVDNFDQVAELYTNEFSDDDRKQCIENMAASLLLVTDFLQEKAIKILSLINSDLGEKIAQALNKTIVT